MTYPAIFEIISGNTNCTAMLGTNPVRFWPFGRAPQDETRPYATHQMVVGFPVNTITCAPRADRMTLQVDCFAQTANACRSLADVLVSALTEKHIIVGSWDLDEIDQPSGLYRVTFSADFYIPRT